MKNEKERKKCDTGFHLKVWRQLFGMRSDIIIVIVVIVFIARVSPDAPASAAAAPAVRSTFQ
jgi:hypothetical protein